MSFLAKTASRVVTPVLSSSRAAFSTSNVQLAPRVQQPAPDFSGTAVIAGGEFKQIKLSDFAQKYVVLMFYPLNFTHICPMELTQFSDLEYGFKDLETQVIGISTDSEYSHLAWLSMSKCDGGLGPINFPLLSDFTKKISTDYDVLLDAGMALRGLFIIDNKGILRHMSVNDIQVTRSAEEVLRLVHGFRCADQNIETSPSGWNSAPANAPPSPPPPPANAQPSPKTEKKDPKDTKDYFKRIV